MIEQAAKKHLEALIEPLCKETEALFHPVGVEIYDRLHISLDKERPTDFIMRPYGELHDGQFCYPSYAAARQWSHKLPEAKPVSDYFRVAGTDFSVIVVNAVWPHDQLVFTTEARTLWDFLLLRFMQQSKRAQKMAEFSASGKAEKKYLDSQTYPLTTYQRAALDVTIGTDAALFMEQGTGKTPVAIAIVCNEALHCKGMYRALVVCPKSVRSNWKNELCKFATLPGKVTTLRGGQLKRVKYLIEAMREESDCRWSIVIASYDVIHQSWDAMRMIKWNRVILDESHYIKSSQTARCKAIHKLRETSDFRSILTGTPVTNSLLDLYGQLEFLGEGLSGFKSWKAFKKYYGRWVRKGKLNRLVSYQNLPLLQERLTRLAFMITKEQALPDLPKKTYDIHEVEMTPKQAKYYIDVRDLLIAESEGLEITATNVLTKLLRLAQITSGFVTWDAEEGEERVIDRLDPNPKVEALVKILKEKTPLEKTIIWSCWVQDIKTIAARLRIEDIDCVTYYGATKDDAREEAVRRFNCDPKCTVFIGNAGAGGVGINLLGYDINNPTDHRADHVIYYSQSWSMVHRSQSEDRCHRIGTRSSVRYTDLCVPGTIDEEIRSRVCEHRNTAYTIQDVKNILKSVLHAKLEFNGD